MDEREREERRGEERLPRFGCKGKSGDYYGGTWAGPFLVTAASECFPGQLPSWWLRPIADPDGEKRQGKSFPIRKQVQVQGFVVANSTVGSVACCRPASVGDQTSGDFQGLVALGRQLPIRDRLGLQNTKA